VEVVKWVVGEKIVVVGEVVVVVVKRMVGEEMVVVEVVKRMVEEEMVVEVKEEVGVVMVGEEEEVSVEEVEKSSEDHRRMQSNLHRAETGMQNIAGVISEQACQGYNSSYHRSKLVCQGGPGNWVPRR